MLFEQIFAISLQFIRCSRQDTYDGKSNYSNTVDESEYSINSMRNSFSLSDILFSLQFFSFQNLIVKITQHLNKSDDLCDLISVIIHISENYESYLSNKSLSKIPIDSLDPNTKTKLMFLKNTLKPIIAAKDLKNGINREEKLKRIEEMAEKMMKQKFPNEAVANGRKLKEELTAIYKLRYAKLKEILKNTDKPISDRKKYFLNLLETNKDEIKNFEEEFLKLTVVEGIFNFMNGTKIGDGAIFKMAKEFATNYLQNKIKSVNEVSEALSEEMTNLPIQRASDEPEIQRLIQMAIEHRDFLVFVQTSGIPMIAAISEWTSGIIKSGSSFLGTSSRTSSNFYWGLIIFTGCVVAFSIFYLFFYKSTD